MLVEENDGTLCCVCIIVIMRDIMIGLFLFFEKILLIEKTDDKLCCVFNRHEEIRRHIII